MPETPIPDPVAAGAETVSEDTILLSSDDGRHYTAGELEKTVAQRAGTLVTAGVSAGDRVAVIVPDRLEAVLTILAVIRCHAVAIPLDPQTGDTEHERCLEAASVDHLVGAGDTNGRAPIDPTAAGETEPIEPSPQPPDQPRTLMFTSGTTGEPSPVVHTAGNHDAAARAAVAGLELGAGDRWYDPLGLHHMGGLAPIIRCLPQGLPVVLSERVGPDGLLERIDRHEATVASVVPTMVHRAIDAEQSIPAKLRCLLVGGAPLREVLFRRAIDVGLPVYASYGLTETVGQVATATPTERQAHPGTVGKPLPGLDIDTIDGDGVVQPPGESGRIAITGPTVSPTTSTPTETGRRLVTEDIGRVDDAGRLWVLGRRDGAIQTGGELVHPQQVEAVLATHPEIEDVAVVGQSDPEWGQRVVAVVVGGTPDVEAVKAWCQSELPSYAIPREVISVDAIPRTPSGTIDRPRLRRRLEAT